MKLRQNGHSPLFVILFIAVVTTIAGISMLVMHGRQQTAGTIAPTQIYPDHAPATKQQVAAAADDFLISRVGKDNFQKFYKQEPSRTSYASPSDSKYDFIAYHFLPSDAYDTSDDIFMVQVNRNNLDEIYTDYAPDCTKNPGQCSFKISRQEAIEIARKHGVSGDTTIDIGNIGDGKNPHLVLSVVSCTQKKSITIDYSTGRVIKIDEGCGDIEL